MVRLHLLPEEVLLRPAVAAGAHQEDALLPGDAIVALCRKRRQGQIAGVLEAEEPENCPTVSAIIQVSNPLKSQNTFLT